MQYYDPIAGGMVAAPHTQTQPEGAKPRRRRKKKRDNGAPKRPAPPFLLFCMEHRERVKTEQPSLKSTELQSELGRMWRGLTEQDKKVYYDNNAKAKVEYDQKLAVYKASLPPGGAAQGGVYPGLSAASSQMVQMLPMDPATMQGLMLNGGVAPKRKKRRRDPNAPKPPPSCFLLYCASRRDAVKAETPGLQQGTRLQSMLGEEWRAMNEEQRKPWKDQYDTLKVEYNTQKKAYVPPKPDPAAQAAMTSLSMQQYAMRQMQQQSYAMSAGYMPVYSGQ